MLPAVPKKCFYRQPSAARPIAKWNFLLGEKVYKNLTQNQIQSVGAKPAIPRIGLCLQVSDCADRPDNKFGTIAARQNKTQKTSTGFSNLGSRFANYLGGLLDAVELVPITSRRIK